MNEIHNYNSRIHRCRGKGSRTRQRERLCVRKRGWCVQILLLFLLLLYGCVITATAATGNSTVRQKTNSMYIFCTASLNWNAWGRGERWRKMESKMFFQDKHNATNLVRLKYSVCHSVPLFRNVFFSLHFILFHSFIDFGFSVTHMSVLSLLPACIFNFFFSFISCSFSSDWCFVCVHLWALWIVPRSVQTNIEQWTLNVLQNIYTTDYLAYTKRNEIFRSCIVARNNVMLLKPMIRTTTTTITFKIRGERRAIYAKNIWTGPEIQLRT